MPVPQGAHQISNRFVFVLFCVKPQVMQCGLVILGGALSSIKHSPKVPICLFVAILNGMAHIEKGFVVIAFQWFSSIPVTEREIFA